MTTIIPASEDPIVTDFQNQDNVYSRDFIAIDVSNTIGDWVDAFNNNALASTDHTWYLGEMLYNGLLYTGRETIGGVTAVPFVNLSIASVPISELVLDNLYLYFRDINKVLLVDHATFDLTNYANSEPMFFYINSQLGFRISQEFNQAANEIMLFRFLIDENTKKFAQCYLTAQRFGSNVYDSAKEFYTVQGCQPLPVGSSYPLSIKLDNGTIKRSGIEIDNHQIPDIHDIVDNAIPFNLRYIENDNTVDYINKQVTYNVDPDHYLIYTTGNKQAVGTGKFTAQRILFDIYENCLIMQYGDSVYETMEEALSSIDNVSYPFPYNALLYIPLGIMFIKQGATDLSDPAQCILVQHLNTSITNTDTAFFAEDSYARGRLSALGNDISVLQQQIAGLLTGYTSLNQYVRYNGGSGPDDLGTNGLKAALMEDDSTNHALGLGDYWIKKNTHDTTNGRVDFLAGLDVGNVTHGSGTVVASGDFAVEHNYIVVNNQRVYVGATPDNAPDGSWAIMNT
jgi:hypothetical protein